MRLPDRVLVSLLFAGSFAAAYVLTPTETVYADDCPPGRTMSKDEALKAQEKGLQAYRDGDIGEASERLAHFLRCSPD